MSRVDRSASRCFADLERMDEYRMVSRVMMAEDRGSGYWVDRGYVGRIL